MIEARPERQYSLAAGIQCWPLDVSSGGPAFLVEVGGDQRFEVTAGVHRVIELLREGPRSSRDLVERLQRDGNESATSEKVSWLLRSVLLPRRIVRRTGDPEAGGDGEASYEQAKKRSSYLWAKVPLASPEAVRPLTWYRRFLFKPWLAAPILTLALGVYAYFYLSILGQFTWSLTSLTAGQAVVLLLVLNATTIFHELGHVSACRYFGSSHGKIGWGIYLFMFVLYADVSQIWRLNRRQRAVVDLGGIYFEVIATLVFFALLLWTGQPFFIYLFLFVNLSIVTSLNPVLRRDGYWLLADLAGEANLRDANMDALRYGAQAPDPQGHGLAADAVPEAEVATGDDPAVLGRHRRLLRRPGVVDLEAAGGRGDPRRRRPAATDRGSAGGRVAVELGPPRRGGPPCAPGVLRDPHRSGGLGPRVVAGQGRLREPRRSGAG